MLLWDKAARTETEEDVTGSWREFHEEPHDLSCCYSSITMIVS